MSWNPLRRIFSTQYMVKPALVQGEFPTTRQAYRKTLQLAGPSMAEAFLLSLVSIADTIMVSGVGTEAIAAVSLVTQPRFILMTPILGLNVAVTSIVARRRGENDPDSAGNCMRQSLLLSFGLSFLACVIALAFATPIMWFAGAQHDTIQMAVDYFRILLLGIPINCVTITICAAQRGCGETRVSMRVNMTANLVNLVFNYLLIGGKFGFPRLGTKGAAIATVIGWTVGFVMALLSVLHKDRFLTVLAKEGWWFERKTLHAIFKVGSGSFVEQLCMRVGFLSYSKVVAALGTQMYTANSIGMNILMLSFSIGDGLSVAAAALVGQNLGAKRPDLSVLYGKVCQRISYISCTLVFVLFVTNGSRLYGLFTDDPVILEEGVKVMLVASVILFGQASQLIFMGCLHGAGDTRYTAVISIVSVMLLRPGSAWLLTYPLGLGLIGAWLGFLLDQYTRMLLTYFRFNSGRWMKIQL